MIALIAVCNACAYGTRNSEIAIPILLGSGYVYVFGPFVPISSAFANTVMQPAILPKTYGSRPIKTK